MKMIKNQWNVCVDDYDCEILDWIHSHFKNGNSHKDFEVTVTMREFTYNEDGEKVYNDEK